MAVYVIEARNTDEAWARMIDSPERYTAGGIQALIDPVGATVHHFWMKYGTTDSLAIVEATDIAQAAILVAARSSGAYERFTMEEIIPGERIGDILAAAQSIKSRDGHG
jgi:uncharacterized protein with GYD domain